MKVIFLALLLITANSVYAQVNEAYKNIKTIQDTVYLEIDKLPEFPGGAEAVLKFISDNFVYPVELEDDCILGRITTRFIINKDGSLTNIHVLRSPDPRLDAEAIRVISMMPKWEPGELKGEPVRVKFIIPIAIETLKRNTGEIDNLEQVENEENDQGLFLGIRPHHPEFTGGYMALVKYMSENVQYPDEAVQKEIEGRVIANFVVNTDGSLSDIKIVRGVDSLLDSEVVRVIAAMPNWEPALFRGKPIESRYTLPVIFKLQNDVVADKDSLNKLNGVIRVIPVRKIQ